MDDDQYQKLKEAEKEHLRELRSLKEAARLVQRQRSITQALEEMTNRSRAVLEENERLIEEITFDTAMRDARLEVAMEGLDPNESLLDEGPQSDPRVRGSTEARAESGEADDSKKGAQETGTGPDRQQGADALPEKTLGRMR